MLEDEDERRRSLYNLFSMFDNDPVRSLWVPWQLSNSPTLCCGAAMLRRIFRIYFASKEGVSRLSAACGSTT